MNIRTDDLRIRDIRELSTPEELMAEYPCVEQASATVSAGRRGLQRILHGTDDRLAVVIGPCSIHDTGAALDYAARLQEQRERFKGSLEIWPSLVEITYLQKRKSGLPLLRVANPRRSRPRAAAA